MVTARHDTPEPPPGACLLHHPPAPGQHWVLADQGYRTCSGTPDRPGCLDRLREHLVEIRDRYHRLTARPQAGSRPEWGRGAPGFTSRPPASLHVIAMRDPRSKPCEVATDGVVYEGWQADNEGGWKVRPLPFGHHGPEAIGVVTSKREAWKAGDGRAHSEQERPGRTIGRTLASLADMIAEQRGIAPPKPPRRPAHSIAEARQCRLVWHVGPMRLPAGVHGPPQLGPVPHPEPRPWPDPVGDLTRWIDNQLDWVTRQEWVVDVADEIRELAAQLRGVEEPRRRVGRCPNTLDEGETTRECGTPLYAPLAGARADSIRCHACGRRWHESEWPDLGDLITA